MSAPLIGFGARWWKCGRTYVPSLREDYAEEEEDEKDASANPSVGCVGCAFVEVGLVYLRRMMSGMLCRKDIRDNRANNN